jgi:hypothetical protein
MADESSSTTVTTSDADSDPVIDQSRSRTHPLVIILFLVICTAIAAVSGSAAWYLVQPQSGDLPVLAGEPKSN